MKKSKYSLGIVSVSFRGYTPREILEITKKAGLSCIEWGSDIHAPHNDLPRLYEISEMQKEYGIFCSSYGTYFRLGVTPIGELESYIRAAKILGTTVLRLWGGEKSGSQMTNEEKCEMLSACRKAAEIAEKNEVTLCLECHKKTITEDPDDAAWLMREVGSPRFRMYWQPFQWQSIAQNVENAKKISSFAEHIHVFNWKGEEKLPLSESITEWRRYLEQFSATHTLLLEFMPKGTLDELSCEADALRLIIGEKI